MNKADQKENYREKSEVKDCIELVKLHDDPSTFVYYDPPYNIGTFEQSRVLIFYVEMSKIHQPYINAV